MTKRKLRHKLHNLLKANGYELKEHYLEMDNKAWIHKDTGQYIAHNKFIVNQLSFLIKYKIDKHMSHGLGFSTHHQAWFGWSHRAIASFKIGSEVKKGDCAYQYANKEDFIKKLEENNLNRNTHDLEIVYNKDETLTAIYTFIGIVGDISQDKYIGDKEVKKYRFDNKGYYRIIPMMECSEGEDCPRLKFEKTHPRGTEYTKEVASHKCKYVEAEPEEYFTPWGKGEWTAKTLEDAKQMAIDFRDDVS